jgi:nicotinate-nucleotide adenylyltransferase
VPKQTPIHIAILGGTFCPIHKGHIQAALSLQQRFKFDRFLFIPNKAPVLDKEIDISTKHRLAMLELALAPYPEFTIDRREINRLTPSFMINTIKSLRDELDDDAIAMSLIIGEDCFQEFHRWHDWETLLTLCNLIVIERPGFKPLKLPDPLEKHLLIEKLKELNNETALFSNTRGGFFRCNAGAYPISSTQIRNLTQKGLDTDHLLPSHVLKYIKEHGLFENITKKPVVK